MQNIYSGSDWDLAAYLKYTRVKLAFPLDHLRHLNTTAFNDDFQGYHHRYLLPPSHHLHHQKPNFGRQRFALGVTATLSPPSFARAVKSAVCEKYLVGQSEKGHHPFDGRLC